MASAEKDYSRNKDAQRKEIYKKIDGLSKIGKELQTEISKGSQQFTGLYKKGRNLRRIFEELENELDKREKAGKPGHVKDNVRWDEARTLLHEVYHKVKVYLDEQVPTEESVSLQPFEPRKLKMAEKSPRKPTDKKKETKSVVSMVSVRSVLPEDSEELLDFIGSKTLKIATKANELNAETNEAKKKAHTSALSRWLDRLEDLRKAGKAARKGLKNEAKRLEYGKVWDDLTAAVQQAASTLSKACPQVTAKTRTELPDGSSRTWTTTVPAPCHEDPQSAVTRRNVIRREKDPRSTTAAKRKVVPEKEQQARGNRQRRGLPQEGLDSSTTVRRQSGHPARKEKALLPQSRWPRTH
jgi:hypothetical protein